MPVTIKLPTLHPDQVRVFKNRGRFNAVRCGRRWGKDVLQNTLATDYAIKGRKVGLFAPEHKQLAEPFSAILDMLAPIRSRSNRTDGLITTSTHGVVDFWATNDNELAGRGREYDLVLINEAAFTKTPQMLNEVWKKSIKPTLLTTGGKVWVFSTPKGVDPENFFFHACHDEKEGFVHHYAPSSGNPLVTAEALEDERKKNNPLVYQQEYDAEFVDWSGVAFFGLDKWLDDGNPWPVPSYSYRVFAKMDTALKSGKEHDGTGILYCAVINEHLPEPHQKLVLLEYELMQIDGDLLVTIMPAVFDKLEHWARTCGAVGGSIGCFIEDKGSGTMLLKQCERKGWPVHEFGGAFVAMGKDERAVSTSAYHHQRLARISEPCYRQLTDYKGSSRNHLVTQVTGFRLADKDAYKRADELVDCYTGALAVTFGDPEGY